MQCNASNYSSATGPRKQDVNEIQADDSDNEGADSFETQVTTLIINHKGCDFELDKVENIKVSQDFTFQSRIALCIATCTLRYCPRVKQRWTLSNVLHDCKIPNFSNFTREKHVNRYIFGKKM